MNETSIIDGALSNLDIRRRQAEEPKSNELGQTAFLELMITQLQNQDPLSPQDNTQFIAQLAQFSSVEGLERLNTNFEGFAGNFTSNRALQASSLVGRSVTVDGDRSVLQQGDLVAGVATLPATTTDLNFNIYGSSGELLRQIPVGFQRSGDVNFRWDGAAFEVNGEVIDLSGSPLPPGEYRFEATATQDGDVEQLDIAVSANVNSVTVEPDGRIVLNLSGQGSVNLEDVKQFN